MLHLNNLKRLVKKRKIVGRGGSRGGTSGRGNKGQNARSGGGTPDGFEGGQMPLYRRLPKRGFNNARFAREVVAVNVGRLDEVCQDGETVTRELLIMRGVVKNRTSKGSYFLKILGHGSLSKKLVVQADLFSKTAVQTIENAGGRVEQITER
jgi:large subunit ribosomal protein L15